MKVINIAENTREEVRKSLIIEAVRHLQSKQIHQDMVSNLMKDEEANQIKIKEHVEGVLASKAAFEAVTGVAVHCFGFSMVDFQNQSYTKYEHMESLTENK